MPIVRHRTIHRSYPPRNPPPLLPVGSEEHEPGPFHATPAARVLEGLRRDGESTLSEILDEFTREDEWSGAARALDELVADGRVMMRVGYRDGRRSGWRTTIAIYKLAV